MLIFKNYFRKTFTIKTIALAAVMLSLTIVIVKFFNITMRIGISNKGQMVIGFGFLPNVIFSFLYGPIWGLIFGVSSDIILFILKPGFYDIFHAIQKPIVGFLSGIFGMIYIFIRTIEVTRKQQWLYFLITQFFLISLVVIIYLVIFVFKFYYFVSSTQKLFERKWELIYQVIFATITIFLFLIIEIIICYNFCKINSDNKDLKLLFVIIFLQLLITICTSWILSPLSNWFWYKIPWDLSLMPRLIKETILMPIRIFLYYSLLKVLFKIHFEKYYFNCKFALYLRE